MDSTRGEGEGCLGPAPLPEGGFRVDGGEIYRIWLISYRKAKAEFLQTMVTEAVTSKSTWRRALAILARRDRVHWSVPAASQDSTEADTMEDPDEKFL